MNIDETRWLIHHFDQVDEIEKASIRLTVEVFKTLAVLILAWFAWELVG